MNSRFRLRIVVAGLVSVAWQPVQAEEPKAASGYPSSRLGVRTAPLLLLSRRDVCADLGLSADQVASAQQVITDLYMQALQLRGKSGPVVVEARRFIDTKQRQWIEQNLKPEQQLRLSEIELQWEGPGALASRVYLADELGLSGEQRERIRSVIKEQRDSGLHTEGSARRSAEAILTVLTPEQAARWRNLLGRPFEVTDDQVRRVSGTEPKR